jgi:hypothetical protein
MRSTSAAKASAETRANAGSRLRCKRWVDRQRPIPGLVIEACPTGPTARSGAVGEGRTRAQTPSHPHNPPSTTYQRLRQTIAERMRMSPIDQPLMLVTESG